MLAWLKRHIGWSLFLAAHLGMAALLYQFIPPLPNWSVTRASAHNLNIASPGAAADRGRHSGFSRFKAARSGPGG